jgi:hypothetical protein
VGRSKIAKHRRTKSVQGLLAVLVVVASSLVIDAAIPVLEGAFSLASSLVYAEEAPIKKSSPQAYELPQNLHLPKITPQMEEVMANFTNEIGTLQFMRNGMLENRFFRKKTIDGLYDILYVSKKTCYGKIIYEFRDQEVEQLRKNILQSIEANAPKEIVDGIQASADDGNPQRELRKYSEDIWDKYLVPRFGAITAIQKQQFIEQQRSMLASQRLDIIVVDGMGDQFVFDVSSGDFRFINMGPHNGDIEGRRKFYCKGIKILMNDVLDKKDQVLAMIGYDQEAKATEDPMQFDYFKFTPNDYVPQEVNAIYSRKEWPDAKKILTKKVGLPNNRWVLQVTFPTIIIKNPATQPRLIEHLYEDPELIKLLTDRGILPKEAPSQIKPQSYLRDCLPKS